MGFSARYHAASLAAVFFALAIGILIGSQIGGDILNSTRDSLEKSLTSDLDESRSQVDELQGQLKTADEFGNSVYPALVGAQLRGDRVGLVGFGDLPGDVTSSAEDAIDASGAELVAVGTVREPPSPADIAESFDKGPFTRLGNNGENSPTMRDCRSALLSSAARRASLLSKPICPAIDSANVAMRAVLSAYEPSFC